ncbi:MAG TPA: Crp/Fnr family transcriptional regulator [Mycobacteriales bacterium]|nr:Crp/Fnr family transcriptional regulator [Mycobacteriales bacterium]
MDERLLAETPLFTAVDEDSAHALCTALVRRTVHRGEVLFAEGDVGDRLFVVVEGKVKISRQFADGRENMLAVLGPGEMFGELSLFDPGPRTASATALTDAVLVELPHDALRPWLSGRPEVASALLRALARRLRRTNDAMADLVFSDVPGRVAKALIDLAERFGEQRADGLHVTHDLTQEELAQLVGASRETVNKALADFAARGWLRIEARAVVILDWQRLERRAR